LFYFDSSHVDGTCRQKVFNAFELIHGIDLYMKRPLTKVD